ncbi:hypothetical protein ACTXT7_000881 [Hymenolepis weldensis]
MNRMISSDELQPSIGGIMGKVILILVGEIAGIALIRAVDAAGRDIYRLKEGYKQHKIKSSNSNERIRREKYKLSERVSDLLFSLPPFDPDPPSLIIG